MSKIRIGDPQPIPCAGCGGMFGYTVADSFYMGYNAEFSANGKYEGGEYSDGRLVHKGVRAFCANCRKLLPFKIERVDRESFE